MNHYNPLDGQAIVNVGIRYLAAHARQPVYATAGAAGADLIATSRITIRPGHRALVKTGIAIQLPAGFEAQIRPRSGLALKKGITVLNTPGTIDADYRGEIGVILINTSDTDFDVCPGERIAQLVVVPVFQAHFVPVTELEETSRGDGGFGSTDSC